MDPKRTTDMGPRKTPRQARLIVTVDAVFEATIQVLLSDGFQRLTCRVSQTARRLDWHALAVFP
jgi:hypothetical protein